MDKTLTTIKRMSWRMWLRGFLVACVDGILYGLVGFVTDSSWKTIISLVLVGIGKKGGEWIHAHPIEDVDETVQIRKEDVEK